MFLRPTVATASRTAGAAARLAQPVLSSAPRVTPTMATQSFQASPIQRQTRGYHEKDNPRNVGSLDKGDIDVGTGLVGAPACGDVMKLQIRVGKDNRIDEVKFKTFGCGSAIASSSYLTELVRGMPLDDAARIKNTEIAKELCLPPVKLHCSMLAEDAIKSAISNYYTKNPKSAATDLGGTGAPLPKIELDVQESPKAANA